MAGIFSVPSLAVVVTELFLDLVLSLAFGLFFVNELRDKYQSTVSLVKEPNIKEGTYVKATGFNLTVNECTCESG